MGPGVGIPASACLDRRSHHARDRLRTLPATALAALLAVVAGCSTATPTAEAAGQPRSGGTLTWAVETEPITLNPHQYAQAKARLLVWNSFEALLTYDDRAATALAGDRLEVTPDGLSYTLTLRDRVTFPTAHPFDAAAVKANLDKLREPGYAPAVAAAQLTNFKAVEASTRAPYGSSLSARTCSSSTSSPPRRARRCPRRRSPERQDLKAGGSTWSAPGRSCWTATPRPGAALPANPATTGRPHRGHRPGHLDEITYRFLKESAVRVGALTSSQVQTHRGRARTDQPLVTGNRRCA